MTIPNAQLETDLAQFAKQPGITPAQQAQLRQAMMADATLLTHLNDAVTAGHLQGFAPSKDPQSNRVGGYDKASGIVTMELPPYGLSRDYNAADMTCVRGHEIQNSFNHAAKERAERDFTTRIWEIARSAGECFLLTLNQNARRFTGQQCHR